MTNERKFVDLTPTWSEVLPILLASLENGGDEGREASIENLRRMALVADRYVALSKEASA